MKIYGGERRIHRSAERNSHTLVISLQHMASISWTQMGFVDPPWPTPHWVWWALTQAQLIAKFLTLRGFLTVMNRLSWGVFLPALHCPSSYTASKLWNNKNNFGRFFFFSYEMSISEDNFALRNIHFKIPNKKSTTHIIFYLNPRTKPSQLLLSSSFVKQPPWFYL